jgi:hypothetical protein
LAAAAEVVGGWQEESNKFLAPIARAKAQHAPAILHTALVAAWVR